MSKRKKLTKNDKLKLIQDNICWKCFKRNTIKKTKYSLSCSECGLKINRV